MRNYNIRPKKRLGQHFIVSQRGIQLFTKALMDAKCSEALEIGSGLGTITLYASKVLDRIVGVELDHKLAMASLELLRNTPNTIIIHGNGERLLEVWRHNCIFSNTPYNLTSRILSIAARNNNITYLVLGVQHDLAKRIMAHPGSKDYGRLTILVQMFFNVKYYGFIPREWFYPQPKVNSAVLLLKRKKTWEPRHQYLEELTACLFSQRNKLARKIISKCAKGITVDIDPNARIRDLPIEFIEHLLRKIYGKSRLEG